jgi:hypothetical protein
VLTHQKIGKVARLKQLDPNGPSYAALVNEIQSDLERIDKDIEDAIKD